jgi:hypothetical protein
MIGLPVPHPAAEILFSRRVEFPALTAAINISLTVTRIMAPSCEGPHVMQCPDKRFSYFLQKRYWKKSFTDPM